MQLVQMTYVPKHSRDHGDSECVAYVKVPGKGAEFIGNKRTHKHTNTQLYVLILILATMVQQTTATTIKRTIMKHIQSVSKRLRESALPWSRPLRYCVSMSHACIKIPQRIKRGFLVIKLPDRYCNGL